VFNHLSRDVHLGLRDHNVVFVPYFAADEAITMDTLWRGKESVLQGKHVLVILRVPLTTQEIS
jgi:hypothetical protein